jgi:DNA replication and repair protein RecF
LLEAIYILGAVKSFRGARPIELIQHGAAEGVIKGSLASEGPRSEVVVTLEKQGRQIRVDGKRADLSVHFYRFPMVAFHPGDLELVFGGPSVRRRFLDRMLFQGEAGYANWYREYRRALDNRNELLRRDGEGRQIHAFDAILSRLGAQIGLARARLSSLLSEATDEILEGLGVEPFSLRLRESVEPNPEALLRALNEALPKDRRLKRTTVGPHTDELELSRPTGMARSVASRGEARSLAVALRLGERKVVAHCASSMPVLLLDDVWAELDRERVERVLSMVASEPGQVIVTGTGASEPDAVKGWRRFEVIGGRVEPV